LIAEHAKQIVQSRGNYRGVVRGLSGQRQVVKRAADSIEIPLAGLVQGFAHADHVVAAALVILDR
jgi:hypothetical protein